MLSNGSGLITEVSDSCDPMDYSLPGSLAWNFSGKHIELAIPFSRGSSQPRDRTWVSHTAGIFFTNWIIRKPRTQNYLILNTLNHLGVFYTTSSLNSVNLDFA